MDAKNILVIVGAGGHGRVVADAALAQGGWTRVAATDGDPARCAGELLPGVALQGYEPAVALRDAVFHVAVGSARAREHETHAIGAQRLAAVIHPAATVSPFAEIGAGTFVAAQAVVAPRAKVGVSTIVNHGAVIDHDCVVGDYTHIAPQASLSGAVRIGARVFLGSGARVLPGLSVCDDVVVGAGAVVIASITEPGVYAGVPARRLK
ncbi:NeuD/PglB/VioB family sugar acetyltransferase [Ramlibacter albus]|uniref:NeuD/PglB/VioB family sugar acetyltransferase n=1 Tax=Ramlibacter albus TaxID=2079448 RepID=A0A923S5C6_9BURK|nr:NeuD/PglB/VioB family sugar acetyltransferase [Ramlibacter albus]MBC5768396.1 NeuD/PglB/VioB family sugar acetyltransferase [Ramlibacter albus]